MNKETAVGKHISLALFQHSERGVKRRRGREKRGSILTITLVRNTRKWIEMLRTIVKKEIVPHVQAVLTYNKKIAFYQCSVTNVPTNTMSLLFCCFCFVVCFCRWNRPSGLWEQYFSRSDVVFAFVLIKQNCKMLQFQGRCKEGWFVLQFRRHDEVGRNVQYIFYWQSWRHLQVGGFVYASEVKMFRTTECAGSRVLTILPHFYCDIYHVTSFPRPNVITFLLRIYFITYLKKWLFANTRRYESCFFPMLHSPFKRLKYDSLRK